MPKIPKQVFEIAQQLREGVLPRRFKVRAILKWFGASRRGSNVLSDIQTTLTNFGIQTEPQLNQAKIDDLVRFHLTTTTSMLAVDSVSSAIVNAPSFSTEKINIETDAQIADESENNNGIVPTEDHLEPEQDEEQQSIRPDDRPVTSQPYDWSISTLRDKLERGQLDLQPKFQREYVWSIRPELPSRLIESLLLEIPVPPIYFGKIENGRLEVIDGQQRLTTLVHFVTNKFSLRKLQRMSSLNGKLFRDLTESQQEKILDAPIRSVVIDAARNTELRYEVFERLNRGSMNLNEQELRNCVYRGPFNDLLAELEKDQNWRRVKGGTEPEKRFIERENILRICESAPSVFGKSKALSKRLHGPVRSTRTRTSQSTQHVV